MQNRHYLYPLSGRPPKAPHGQHNLAWEISGDYRFQNGSGGIEDLLKEIVGTTHNVILSSEDFGCSIHHFEHFTKFIRRLQSHQFEVKLLVYFRNQIDYARSLYFSLLYFGFDRPFDDFLDEILARGQCTWRDWICAFCYRDFLQSLEAIGGVDIIVRSFENAKKRSLIADCLSNFELEPADLGIRADIHANEQMDLHDAVGKFCQHRLGRLLTEDEKRIAASLASALREARIDLSTGSRLKISQRFKDSNEYLFDKYHIARFERMQLDQAEVDGSHERICMETVFSSSLHQFIESAAQDLATSGLTDGADALLMKAGL
ncbi:MAG TPA: hypothetical protein VF345_02090 [Chthoniobacterales bacterium]